MPTLGAIDLVLAVLIALTFFGPERLPAAARALRRMYRFSPRPRPAPDASENAPTPDVKARQVR
ncbi:MAG TPA: twin-arginine translocase TatA/TatE family subunit [Solirubrobacteraceae bacterium]|nr:twin-arginine translocase TatA/TatE family subunit [Solirubrobacteraceae bacterium]